MWSNRGSNQGLHAGRTRDLRLGVLESIEAPFIHPNKWDARMPSCRLHSEWSNCSSSRGLHSVEQPWLGYAPSCGPPWGNLSEDHHGATSAPTQHMPIPQPRGSAAAVAPAGGESRGLHKLAVPDVVTLGARPWVGTQSWSPQRGATTVGNGIEALLIHPNK